MPPRAISAVLQSLMNTDTQQVNSEFAESVVPVLNACLDHSVTEGEYCALLSALRKFDQDLCGERVDRVEAILACRPALDHALDQLDCCFETFLYMLGDVPLQQIATASQILEVAPLVARAAFLLHGHWWPTSRRIPEEAEERCNLKSYRHSRKSQTRTPKKSGMQQMRHGVVSSEVSTASHHVLNTISSCRLCSTHSLW